MSTEDQLELMNKYIKVTEHRTKVHTGWLGGSVGTVFAKSGTSEPT